MDLRNPTLTRYELLGTLGRGGFSTVYLARDTAPPEIMPVIIEGPPIVEPPPELAHLHFNDRLLYVMAEPRR